MRSRTWLRWSGLVLGLAVLGVVIARLAPHWDALAGAWSRLGAGHLLASIACLFAAELAFAWAWHRLLRAPGESGRFADDAARWATSLAGKYFPGKVWHAVARYGLYHNGPHATRVAPAYLREMLLSFAVAMALVAWGAGDGPAVPMLRPLFALGALLLGLLAMPGPGEWVVAMIDRRWPGRLAVAATGWSAYLAAAIGQMGGYVLLGLGIFALGRGLGWFQADEAPLAIAAFCFAGLAGVAALFVPAGIGVREAALAWFLAPALGAGPALMVALLARAWISLGEAACIGAGLAWLRKPRAGAPTA